MNHVLETGSIRGHYGFFSFSRDLTPVELALARNYARGKEPSAAAFRLPITGFSQHTNLIPTVGKNVLARRLANDPTYTGIINYGAFGSGTTPFTNASTQLNTEVFRAVPSGATFDDNVAYIDWYVAVGDVADQTFQEFGAFIDGTGSANSGRLFSALITGGWVKSGSVFVSLRVTLT
jgi:hypothetical protein